MTNIKPDQNENKEEMEQGMGADVSRETEMGGTENQDERKERVKEDARKEQDKNV